MLEIKGLRKVIGGRSILSGVDLSVGRGQVLLLVGPNGVGKTTTMRCIFGDLLPDSGEILWMGEKVERKKEDIAVLLEDRAVFRGLSGSDYMGLFESLYPNFNRNMVLEKAAKYRWNLDTRLSQWSMGEKTLFMLSLIMASGAGLVLADEPFQHLDPMVRAEVINLISQMEDRAVLMATHDIYEAEEVATHIAIMKAGRIIYYSDVDTAKAEHRVVQSIPQGAEVIGNVTDGIVVKGADVGRNATLREIVLAYLGRV